ncbi:MAG: hypothetical protein AAGA20_19690 [Planctomycetota bacterium]
MPTSVAALLLAALSADEIDPSVWSTSGQRVPAVELPLIDGSGTLSLADLRGRKLLLIQFASW